MSELEILKNLCECMQIQELNLDMELKSLDEWDSLAIISVVSFFSDLGISLKTSEINNCNLVSDLVVLIKNKNDF